MVGETNKVEVEREVLDPIRWVSDGFMSMAAAQAEAQTNAEAEAARAPGPSPLELGESRMVRSDKNTSESCSDENEEEKLEKLYLVACCGVFQKKRGFLVRGS